MPAVPTKAKSPCCANCWRGSATWRATSANPPRSPHLPQAADAFLSGRVPGKWRADLYLLARQRLVYATLGDRIKTDEVHALSMKTHTPAEWANAPSE